MTALHFLILSLSVFRLTHMVTGEAGPFWMFKAFRREVKKKAPKVTHMDDGIECPMCMSMQLALLVATLEYFFHGNPFFEGGMLAFALSGASIIFHLTTKKLLLH